jgi:hypothetical protein
VRSAKVTLAVGGALLLIVVAIALTRAPPRLLSAGLKRGVVLEIAHHDQAFCQAGEVLPADASAIRLSLGAYYGSRLRVTALSGSRVLTEGTRGPDWTSASVTVPVTPLVHPVSHVKLCIHLGPNSEAIYVFGVEASPQRAAVADTGESLGGRVGVEYLGSSEGSWWSRLLTVARHMGLGHALTGTWVALLIAALMATAGGLAVRLALREMR